MKTLAIGFLFLTSSLSMANPTNDKEGTYPAPEQSDYTEFAVDVSTNYLQIPYSSHYEIPMMFLAQRGEYSLYKCESGLLRKVPSCQLKGENYHYFVYKNGKFHMSVNECNQNAVYNFFTNNQSAESGFLTEVTN